MHSLQTDYFLTSFLVAAYRLQPVKFYFVIDPDNTKNSSTTLKGHKVTTKINSPLEEGGCISGWSIWCQFQ